MDTIATHTSTDALADLDETVLATVRALPNNTRSEQMERSHTILDYLEDRYPNESRHVLCTKAAHILIALEDTH